MMRQAAVAPCISFPWFSFSERVNDVSLYYKTRQDKTRCFGRLISCARTIVLALAAIAGMLFATSAAHAQTLPTGVRVVDHNATGTGDGLSWPNAYTTLQEAMTAAADPQTTPQIDQIWVAAGTYKPTSVTDRTATHAFRTDPALKIYGGFAGGETALNQRDHLANLTILSGDLLGNDAPGFLNREDNSFHIVTASQVQHSDSLLDGFIIRGGNAIGAAPGGTDLEAGGGAGMFIIGTATFGGIDSRPTIVRCIFEDNLATVGAGVYLASPQRAPSSEIRNCTFRNNRATDGAGVYVDDNNGAQMASSPLIYNCVMHDNVAINRGSAIFGDKYTSPQVVYSTVTQNSCLGSGGAIQSIAQGAFGVGTLRVTSAIVFDNVRNAGATSDYPAQIAYAQANLKIIRFSDVQNWVPTGADSNNITDDPQFIDPNANNFRVPCASPARDAGLVTAVKPDRWDLDQDANDTEDNPDSDLL